MDDCIDDCVYLVGYGRKLNPRICSVDGLDGLDLVGLLSVRKNESDDVYLFLASTCFLYSQKPLRIHWGFLEHRPIKASLHRELSCAIRSFSSGHEKTSPLSDLSGLDSWFTVPVLKADIKEDTPLSFLVSSMNTKNNVNFHIRNQIERFAKRRAKSQ
jgi:hypothetical protein